MSEGIQRGHAQYGSRRNSEDGTLLARWESGGGKDWIELWREREGYAGLKGPVYSYRGRQCGGGIQASSDSEAIQKMEQTQVRLAFNDNATHEEVLDNGNKAQ